MLDTNVWYSNLCGVTSSKDNKYDTQLKFNLKRPPLPGVNKTCAFP